jgi:hypothetical protein
MNGQLHAPADSPTGKELPVRIVQEAGWAPVGLDDVEKRKFLTSPGLELRPLLQPARSQALYRLRYPGPIQVQVTFY